MQSNPIFNLLKVIRDYVSGLVFEFVEAEPRIASLHTPASSARLQLAPLFGLSETCSSPLSSFVFLGLHFASWRWGIDQKQNG